MNAATPNIPTPIRAVSTTSPPAMANRPLGPAPSAKICSECRFCDAVLFCNCGRSRGGM